MIWCYCSCLAVRDHGNPPFTPHQPWSHSTNKLSKLFIALEDSAITAVEADILMGQVADPSGNSSPRANEPIMAHPPHTQSDLSSRHFHDLVTSSIVFFNADIFPGPGRRTQSGHLDAHGFVEICPRNITQLKERGAAVPFAFSLEV
jgi:hypothetical protein